MKKDKVRHLEETGEPMTTQIEKTIATAMARGASDIFIDPLQDGTARVALKIDGVISELSQMKSLELEKAVARLRVLMKMAVDQGYPAEGSFRVHEEDSSVTDIRCAMMKTLHGTALSLRIHSPRIRRMMLSELGLTSDQKELLSQAFQAQSGLILITGPTGSGKTTTLYTCLENFCSQERRIISVEDPAEYSIPGMLQIDLSTCGPLSPAQALRSVLRHNPDILVMGEIRDAQCAETLLQSALTGHLVAATIHGANGDAAITKLAEWGCRKEIIESSINLIVSQNLTLRDEPFFTGGKTLRRIGRFTVTPGRGLTPGEGS